MRWIKTLGLLAVFAASECLAAPTTKPAVKAKPDPSTVVVANDTYHFTFRVPKVWKKLETTGPLIAYSLPGNGHVRPPVFSVLYGSPCHSGATLEEQVDSERKQFVAAHPDTKMAKDEAAEVAATPAWQFVYNDTLHVKVTTTTGAKSETKDEIEKIRVMKVMAIQGSTVFVITLAGPAGDFDASSRLAQKAMNSWQWTDAADATASPAAETKK